ncbi:hypothetical protein Pmani_011622 [Petrolisthes manimaculis]|uniref:Tr-type G domain-containing protein n=1 Tax=Petrolisthes manimaculis TaxID=1843537 RepID=A0AAE1UBE7_9EUCA|nr:hypothetical protein Pmani_011622 [Petrolisthes manimaculis]
MSRHRDVRNLDYDEEYDEAYDDDVYGHSVDDNEYGVSPGMEQYLYSRSRENSHGFGLYLPTSEDIKEEDEVNGQLERQDSDDRSRHDSSSYEKPPLSSEEETLLCSVLDELRNILGDKYSEAELTRTAITHNFQLEASLNALLNMSSPTPVAAAAAAAVTATTTTNQSLPQREKRPRSRGGSTNTPAAEVKQLSLSSRQPQNQGQAAPPGLSTPEPKSQQQQMVVTARSTPVVVATPAKGAGTASSKVVRGFVLDSEDSASPASYNNSVSTEDQEAKRSRSSTPVRGNNKERDKESTPSTPLAKPPPKIRDKTVDVCSEYQEQRGSGKTLLNLVVVGHVDAGKSTLMGHLLYLKGNVAQRTMHKYEQESRKLGKQSFMYAWVLDDTEEERSRGVTVDVAQRVFETESKVVTLLDAPGHRDFIPNMITGAARADVAILVVDASTGAFEAGFESGGQTREHAILIRSLGVSQLTVAVNKLDTADWSEERFREVKHSLRQFLKTVGFRDADVVYIPCSGLTGENLVEPSKNQNFCAWYSGPTLLQAIDNMTVPERGVVRPVRMCVGDVYKGQGSSMCVSGRLDTGYVQASDRLLLLPQGDVLNVKNVQTDRAGAMGSAFAGDHVTLTVGGVDPSVLHIGDFLCDPAHPIPLTSRVQGRIVVFNIIVPLIKGAQVDFHYQATTEPARIRKLVSQLHKTTGQLVKSRPRALVKNTAALVELEFTRPLCLELFRDYKDLGRFMLRSSGSTIAAGLITQVCMQ